jgi:hypothetical protein
MFVMDYEKIESCSGILGLGFGFGLHHLQNKMKEIKKMIQTKYSIPFVAKISTIMFSVCKLNQHFFQQFFNLRFLKYLQHPSQVKQIHKVTIINRTTICYLPCRFIVYGTNIVPKNELLFLLYL